MTPMDGTELLLENLMVGAPVLLEAIAPPEPLYIGGVVMEIVARCVIVRMVSRAGEGTVRLHANKEGRFVTDEDRPVRVFLAAQI